MSFFAFDTLLYFSYYSIIIAGVAGACLLLFIWHFNRMKIKKVAFSVQSVSLIEEITPSLRVRLFKPVTFLLLMGMLTLLLIAALRPVVTKNIEIQKESRDLILAIDVSKSMSTRDFSQALFRISRLEAVKNVAAEFIQQRTDDRIGLVVFGSEGFVQSPLTYDHKLLLDLLRDLQVGVAGDGTAIGDGIGVSLKRMQEAASEQASKNNTSSVETDTSKEIGHARAIILVTDGVSNSGKVNPIQAAKVAKEFGIKIHTIGIGSAEDGGSFEFDEATLKEIASLTGGLYMNGGNLQRLKNIYEEINRLEMTQNNTRNPFFYEEVTWRYIFIAFLLYVLYILLQNTYFFSVP
jgi:Ca-activated chloride channel homolog